MNKICAVILVLMLAMCPMILSSGRAEALPDDLYRAEGGLRLSEAPADDLKLNWMRVDVRFGSQIDDDMLWAEVWVPWPPGMIKDLMLFDGYRIVHGWWLVHEDGHLTVGWRMDDVTSLDGTVGIYLMAVFD